MMLSICSWEVILMLYNQCQAITNLQIKISNGNNSCPVHNQRTCKMISFLATSLYQCTANSQSRHRSRNNSSCPHLCNSNNSRLYSSSNRPLKGNSNILLSQEYLFTAPITSSLMMIWMKKNAREWCKQTRRTSSGQECSMRSRKRSTRRYA